MPSRLIVLLPLVLVPLASVGCTAPAGPPAAPDPSGASAAPVPPAPPAATPDDPRRLTTDGIGPYRVGGRVDAMPENLFDWSSTFDAATCPGVYSRGSAGPYGGELIVVVRDGVLVEVFTASGRAPAIHTAEGDKIGDAWTDVEARHGPGTPAPGAWHTNGAGERAFIVPYGDRVILFSVNPVRPDGIGGISAGRADHTQRVFLAGTDC